MCILRSLVIALMFSFATLFNISIICLRFLPTIFTFVLVPQRVQEGQVNLHFCLSMTKLECLIQLVKNVCLKNNLA